MLELVGLGKDYGARTAVQAIDLVIRRGEIFGLLGPNGAGKTTTISMACGVVPPSRGTARIAGHDIRSDAFAAKRAIGLVPQDLALYDDLSPRQNLAFFGQLYGLTGAELARRIDWALGVAGLGDRAGDLVKTFSGGMKRRLNLAAGLIHQPTLLVLDEPTVGVDPQSRRHIFDSIRALQARGMTILYTSHYMEEVEELCDRVAIMDAGAVVASGTLAELRAQHGAGGLEVEIDGDGDAIAAAAAAAAPLGGTRTGAVLRFEPRPAYAPALAAIEATGAQIKRIGAQRADLETVFLALTGRGLRDA
ncbi:MAG: ABC transporter ATP-binding protein [Deltaproteobacteria bacterium]|nr:MAG: ABC transporter ATP-binding protein [Deltaproteobacteria bacterium]TMQ24775.1 MAG: ABC transporter ATP-binding protein [Deltaproteobacteria bacterium]